MFRPIVSSVWLGFVFFVWGGVSSPVWAQFCPAERACQTACCAKGSLCSQGKCVAFGRSCSQSSDCPAGQFCAVAFRKCLGKIKNNVTCKYRPPIGKFTPTTLWEWRSSRILPTYNQVMMTPVVMALQDTNKNGKIDVGDVPSVIFISHVGGGSYSENGVLRALRGDNGKEIFTVTDSRYRVNGLGSLAVADIDNDGKPDIVASRFAGKGVWQAGLHAFDNTGKHKWTTHYSNGKIANLPVSWGGAAIADLNGDGQVEVILGKTVIRGRDGQVLCTGVGGKGNGSPGQRMPLSVIADIDNDGQQEIITGNAVYRYDCQQVWSSNEADGYVAVADFNLDGKAEIAVVSPRSLRIQDAQTGKVLVRLNQSAGGGPPTIGDFNGDGKPDVAYAGRSYYYIYTPDFKTKTFKLLWRYRTQDYSSGRTGSSIFDFEGDKKAEAVYNDERYMRVFAGSNGKVLFSSPNVSSTSLEYPVIVDVNNDGRANIVVSSNHGSMAHIRVFRDILDNWVDTRNVWNQHTYSVTNICTGGNDPFCPKGSKFGQVPRKPFQNWKVAGLNNFRQNVQGKGLFQAADLILRDMRASWLAGCKNKVEVGVWAYNKGAKKIPTGIPVTFYQGTASRKTKLVTIRIRQEIQPGEGVWLKVTVSIAKNVPKSLYVAIDDDGTGKSSRNECDKKNNFLAYVLPPVGGGEKCDGKDNDCNGQIDETWPNKGKACSIGSGGCKRSGKWQCKTDGSGIVCNATVIHPQKEKCDGKDNDCDGKIDETWPNKGKACSVGAGVCKADGKWQCKKDGSGISCSVQAGVPTPEKCDNKDNDCDGQIDELLFRECKTACGRGKEVCSKGVFGKCSAPKPKKEVCNGKDDDCNGQIDDKIVVISCQSPCGGGKARCVSGKLVCDARKPTPEKCNGKDDDCDGKVDDGIPKKACSGACGSGFARCQNGQWAGCSDRKPTPEVCNGKDDDCNGQIDDLLRRPCKSKCGSGYETCDVGTWKSCSAPKPQPELCNGKDDDCDGKTDNAVKCPADAKCIKGVCQRKCRNGECPAGSTCKEDGFCDGDPCKKIKCPSGKQCIAARCVDPCSLVTCPDKLVCQAGTGKCYRDDCFLKGCPKGQLCTEGVCQRDPCIGFKCKPNQFCRSGKTGKAECVASCSTVSCDATEQCIDGVCQPDPGKSGACATKKCPKGELCRKGVCVEDACSSIRCDVGHVCKEGGCVEDPCLAVRCPKGEQCRKGQCFLDPNAKDKEPHMSEASSEEKSGEEVSGTTDSPDTRSSLDASFGDSRSSSTGQRHDSEGSDDLRYASGCGCQTDSPYPPVLLFTLFLLLLGRRRPRQVQ